jgi:hypothetical protein
VAAEDALAACECASPTDLPAALTAAAAAHTQHSRTAAGAAVPPVLVARARYLSTNERACPLLTALVRPPKSSTSIPALASPSGALLTSHKSMADRLVAHFAGVSALPRPDAIASARVLAALASDITAGSQRPSPPRMLLLPAPEP